jgi:multiple sugar transport system permease protein
MKAMATPSRSMDRGTPHRLGAPRSASRHSWRQTLTGWGFVLPACVVIVGLTIFPSIWSAWLSTQKTDFIVKGTNVGAENYRTLVADPRVWQAVRTTLLYTALFVPSATIVGLLIALALNQRLRGNTFYRTCIFVPFVASAAATGILASFVFNKDFGIANDLLHSAGLEKQPFFQDPTQALWLLVIISLWGSVGFNVVVYLAALQDISGDIVEAAKVDGAYRWATFRHVVAPSLTPVTVFQLVWGTITSLQFFELIVTTTNGGPVGKTSTLVFFLYEVGFLKSHRYGYGAAIAVSLAVVTLTIALFMMLYSRTRKVKVV